MSVLGQNYCEVIRYDIAEDNGHYNMLQQSYRDEDNSSCFVIAELKNCMNNHHDFEMRIWYIAPSFIYNDMITIGGMDLTRENKESDLQHSSPLNR